VPGTPAGDGALRFLNSGAAPPAWNLALDEALWRCTDGVPLLRVYGWRPEGLSLGRFQPHAATVAAIPLPDGTPVIRRSTGGGAIYHHSGELTYSVVVDLKAAGLPRDVTGSYGALHGMVAAALQTFGIDAAHRGDAGAHPGDTNALCFERRMPVDLLAAGRKICGSAQRRRGDLLLQQGSILLTPNPLVPDAVSVQDLALEPVSWGALATALMEQATVLLDRPARADQPTRDELARAAAIRAARYGHDEWTNRVP
jgi:lipoate-protein ligase A